jgi:hypothetical protein
MSPTTKTKVTPLEAAEAAAAKGRAALAEAEAAMADIDQRLNTEPESVTVEEYSQIATAIQFRRQQLPALEAKVAKARDAQAIEQAQAIRGEYDQKAPELATQVLDSYEASVKAINELFASVATFNEHNHSVKSRAGDLHYLHPEDEPRALKAARSQVTARAEDLAAFQIAAAALGEATRGLRLTPSDAEAIRLLQQTPLPTPEYFLGRVREVSRRLAADAEGESASADKEGGN